jgi:hypothetical protein
VTKKHIRNAGNYFTNGELMHRLTPPEFERSAPLTLCRDCDERMEGISSFAGPMAAAPC